MKKINTFIILFLLFLVIIAGCKNESKETPKDTIQIEKLQASEVNATPQIPDENQAILNEALNTDGLDIALGQIDELE